MVLLVTTLETRNAKIERLRLMKENVLLQTQGCCERGRARAVEGCTRINIGGEEINCTPVRSYETNRSCWGGRQAPGEYRSY